MPADEQRERSVEVARRFFAALEAIDIEAFVDLWAEDGVQVMPFSPVGFPDRLEGREAIRHQYGGMPKMYTSMRFELDIHPMLDPRKVVVQYHGRIDLADGGQYNNTYCGILEVEDSKVARFTEYFDPIVLQQSFGGEALGETFGLSASSGE